MKRRNFLKKTVATGSTAFAASTIGMPVIARSIPGKKFKLFQPAAAAAVHAMQKHQCRARPGLAVAQSARRQRQRPAL